MTTTLQTSPLFDKKAKRLCLKLMDDLAVGEGKMFGVLCADDAAGDRVVLKAFSGQLDGKWERDGWCPPAFDAEEYDKILKETDEKVRLLASDEAARHEVSCSAMQKLFSLYKIHCIDGSVKSYAEIFGSAMPPSGTGDCAAIKLLNEAFKRGLHPVSMAEFFYGGTNQSGEKENCQFYPPCEKCRPLLHRMLGLDILYLDQEIIVVNKPAGLLSVPGRGEDKGDCVVSRVKRLFPECIDNPAVHRLDMDTSGLLVLALTQESQRFLSMEFENRRVHKKYTALLDGILRSEGGRLALPFRLSPENRPYQVYDRERGRVGITEWRRLKVYGGRTLVEFTPITGRTHQLRVAAASVHGLGVPIVGDRLYGKRLEGERLMLHTGYLSFVHPYSKKIVTFQADVPF